MGWFCWRRAYRVSLFSSSFHLIVSYFLFKVSLTLVTSFLFSLYSLLTDALITMPHSHGESYHQRFCGKQEGCRSSRRRSQESERQGLTIGYLYWSSFIQAYKTTWGLHCPGVVRGKLLNKLADLIEKHADEFAALESLDVGKFDCSLIDWFHWHIVPQVRFTRTRDMVMSSVLLRAFDTTPGGQIRFRERPLR